MRYLTSTSGSDGTSSITATFDVGRDKDLAAVDVQNRVNTALPRLPAEVKNTGVTVIKTSPAIVIAGGLLFRRRTRSATSSSATTSTSTCATSSSASRASADVQIFGERKYAMRALARSGPAGGARADRRRRGGRAARAERHHRGRPGRPAAGAAGQTFQISVRSPDGLTDPREFEQLVLKRDRRRRAGAAARRGPRRAGRRGLLLEPRASTAATPSASACCSCPTPTRSQLEAADPRDAEPARRAASRPSMNTRSPSTRRPPCATRSTRC